MRDERSTVTSSWPTPAPATVNIRHNLKSHQLIYQGDITGQTRPINTVDLKPSRPFRIVTGSEDNTAAVYEGPPFKFKGTKTDHTRYCQVSPSLYMTKPSPL